MDAPLSPSHLVVGSPPRTPAPLSAQCFTPSPTSQLTRKVSVIPPHLKPPAIHPPSSTSRPSTSTPPFPIHPSTDTKLSDPHALLADYYLFSEHTVDAFHHIQLIQNEAERSRALNSLLVNDGELKQAIRSTNSGLPSNFSVLMDKAVAHYAQKKIQKEIESIKIYIGAECYAKAFKLINEITDVKKREEMMLFLIHNDSDLCNFMNEKYPDLDSLDNYALTQIIGDYYKAQTKENSSTGFPKGIFYHPQPTPSATGSLTTALDSPTSLPHLTLPTLDFTDPPLPTTAATSATTDND